MERRLYRSETDRMLSGVCGGLAEYFDIDPVLVRLVFALFVFAGGAGILAYLVLAIIVPVRSKVGLPPKEVAHEGIQEMAQEARAWGEEVRSAFSSPKTGPGTPGEAASPRRGTGRQLAGAILILMGIVFLASNIFPWFGWDRFWPLIIVLIGVWLLVQRVR